MLVLMPLAGLFIGAGGYLLFRLFAFSTLSVSGKAILLTLSYLVLTGGLHMDGLMDMADAYFSRAGREKRLEIMKDSRTGAFGVMAFGAVILLKIACFTELIGKTMGFPVLLLFIPLLSRIVQAFILCSFPYAKADGLAVTFKAGAGKKTVWILAVDLAFTVGAIYGLTGGTGLYLPGGLLLFSFFYYFWVRKNFGGITGDIAGGFVELAELLMLALCVFI